MKKTIFLAITGLLMATVTTSCNQDRDDSFDMVSTSTNANTAEANVFSRNGNNYSVLSFSECFSEIKTNSLFRWSYSKDGCFARAHKMRRILESKGVPSNRLRKIWIGNDKGALLNGWTYHVALLVIGEDGNVINGKVIDPALFPNGPVSPNDWNYKCDNTRKNKAVINSVTNYVSKNTYRDHSNKLICQIDANTIYHGDFFGNNQSADRAADCVLNTIANKYNSSNPNAHIDISGCTGRFTAR
ncbi:hypothetical protein D1631_06355 [Chryseobacterium nematophagum]|uniref:Protein glutaminase domain-containing protein n=1 Tax=Chryseobacterium nematophagum TaxID=2305228 RepID=A0A3M7TES3_9FLAO|nr:protein-glutamine glutaminase family protein [Chryseobacterium nematophagum]RNA61574.1 hypothetical protein D1631_06355 [Chryseobacterium nematophagum]